MRLTSAGELFMVYKEVGETMESISDHFDISLVQLCYINGNLSDTVFSGEDLEIEKNKLNERSGHIFIPMTGKAKQLFEEYNIEVQEGKFKVVFNEVISPTVLTARIEKFGDEGQRQKRILSLNLDSRYTNIRTLD